MSQAQFKTRPDEVSPIAVKTPYVEFRSRHEAEELIRAAIDDENLRRQEFFILSAINFLEGISVKKTPFGLLRNALKTTSITLRREQILMGYTAIVRGL